MHVLVAFGRTRVDLWIDAAGLPPFPCTPHPAMKIRTMAVVALLTAWTTPARAQVAAAVQPTAAGEYHPSLKEPKGREIVAVFISASTCIANYQPGFKPAVRQMMRRLGAQRDSLRTPISIMGVSTDWETRVGIAYLQELGDFDELAVGRNWFNAQVMRYVWTLADGVPSEPQVILIEHTVSGTSRVEVTPDRILARFVGGEEIEAWVARGAPVTGLRAASTATVPVHASEPSRRGSIP
jgi:hypothetical protein